CVAVGERTVEHPKGVAGPHVIREPREEGAAIRPCRADRRSAHVRRDEDFYDACLVLTDALGHLEGVLEGKLPPTVVFVAASERYGAFAGGHGTASSRR